MIKNYICSLIISVLRIVLIVLLALFFSGCFEQPDCLITNTNILKIAFKGKTLGKDTTFTFKSIRSLKSAEALYTNKSLPNAEVPLQGTDTVATIIFDYDLKTKPVSDTLTITYRNEMRVISPDCGAYLYQKDVFIRKTNFEKVRVTTPVLLKAVTKNLEIFI